MTKPLVAKKFMKSRNFILNLKNNHQIGQQECARKYYASG